MIIKTSFLYDHPFGSKIGPENQYLREDTWWMINRETCIAEKILPSMWLHPLTYHNDLHSIWENKASSKAEGNGT